MALSGAMTLRRMLMMGTATVHALDLAGLACSSDAQNAAHQVARAVAEDKGEGQRLGEAQRLHDLTLHDQAQRAEREGREQVSELVAEPREEGFGVRALLVSAVDVKSEGDRANDGGSGLEDHCVGVG